MSKRLVMGSKYFGRTIKKWRLIAALSQEDLARRAEVSVATLGAVERGRAYLSEENFCKLCLGLESELGRPMLATIFQDSIEGFWTDLQSKETGLRQERGLEAAEYSQSKVNPEELSLAFDAASAEVKRFTLLCYRAFTAGRLGDVLLDRHAGDGLRQEISRSPTRARVRKKH